MWSLLGFKNDPDGVLSYISICEAGEQAGMMNYGKTD